MGAVESCKRETRGREDGEGERTAGEKSMPEASVIARSSGLGTNIRMRVVRFSRKEVVFSIAAAVEISEREAMRLGMRRPWKGSQNLVSARW